MTRLTTVGGGDVVTRFTGRIVTVMAGDTVAGHTAVIERGTRKRISVVAVVTGIAALDMVGRFTRCGAAVMTADTAALNFGVVYTAYR